MKVIRILRYNINKEAVEVLLINVFRYHKNALTRQRVHFYFFELLSSAVIDISFSANLLIEDLSLIVSLSLKYVPINTIAVKPSITHTVTPLLYPIPQRLSYC